MVKHTQNGFGLVEGLLVVVVLLLLGFGGFYVLDSYNNDKDSKSNNTNSANTDSQNSDEVELATYKNETFGVELQYPSDWVKEETTGEQLGAEYPTVEVTFKTPSNNIMYLKTDYGGKGGVCEPAATDVPHSKTNLCTTEEVLDAEKLSVRIPAEPKYADSGEIENLNTFSNLYRINRKYSGFQKDSVYEVCLTDSDAEAALAKGPVMGAIHPEIPVSINDFVLSPKPDPKVFFYLYSCMTSDSENIFQSEDGKAAMEVLRSLKLSDPVPQP